PLTTTLCSDSMVPSPLKTVTLFFFSRNSTPRQSWLTTASLRLSTAGQSICRPSVLRRSAPALWIWWASSDECRNDFVGMQPRCRQVPPTFSFSMTATLSPNWAPRIAPTYPAEPPPMTATSNASSGIQNDCRRHPAAHLTLQQRQCRGQLRVLREVVWGPVNGIFVLRVGERDLLDLLLAAARHEDGAGPLVDELADHVVGGVHVSTRVIAQIEHDHGDRALEIVPERLVELGRGPAAELEDSHVEHAVIKDMRGDTWHVDVLAGDVEAQRLAVSTDLELNRGSRFAADVAHRIVGGPPFGALSVDGGHHVPRLEARFLRRRSWHDADEHDLVRLLLHRGPDPGELAAEEALVGPVLIGGQVAGELVAQCVDHAGRGTLGQRDAAGIGLDVVLL